MYCPQCGYQHDSAVCPNCGASNPRAAYPPQNGGYNNGYNNGYGAPNNGYGYSNPDGSFNRNIIVNKRSIATCILLTIITCGIYGIIWFVSLTDDVNALSNEPNPTSGGTAFLYVLITCGIYSWIWMFKQGDKIDRARQMRGMAPAGHGVVYLLLALFGLGLISYALMQNEVNNLAG